MDHLTKRSQPPINVLMTGAGAPGGPGIIKALQKGPINLFTGDNNPFASGRFLNEEFVELPKADDPGFIPFVLDYCRQSNIQVVFPLVTRELFQFAKHKQAFAANNIHVLVSDEESLNIANDKGKLYEHLQQHGVPVPAFRIVHDVEALVAAATALGYPAKPVCMKPTVSNGSRGVRVLQETVDDYDLLFHHKPSHLFATLPQLVRTLEGRPFPEILVSDYLPGEEYTVDTIVHEGKARLVLPRVRLKMNGGISVQGRFEQNGEIINYCKDIIHTLNLSGPIGLQVKADTDGTFRLLEINPRIQGTSVAAMGLGINLPLLAVLQLFSPIDFEAIPIPWGTSFVRYYEEVFY